VMKLLQAAGLPEGVVNFIPGPVAGVVSSALSHPDLAGVHFTGSTHAFQEIAQTVGENVARYKAYPRIVGETGGKDFVFAHPSADVSALVTALVRGAFEYQGQKCSAASRAYLPRSLWPRIKDELRRQVSEIRVGTPLDFRNFMAAVIHEEAFDRIMSAIQYARDSGDAEILIGGEGNKSAGYFVSPTVILTSDPHFRLMKEEIFGPVLTIFVYEEDRYEETLDLCNASLYGLTGAIFARDRQAIAHLSKRLRHAAGNFYVNDKPTGAVVGQQPFGGSRASGTNDKAGSLFNLLRWTSPRAIKETFAPPVHFSYPFMR
jgi:1-pyrroline-5-carboxylate dehydrogenase